MKLMITNVLTAFYESQCIHIHVCTELQQQRWPASTNQSVHNAVKLKLKLHKWVFYICPQRISSRFFSISISISGRLLLASSTCKTPCKPHYRQTSTSMHHASRLDKSNIFISLTNDMKAFDSWKNHSGLIRLLCTFK